MTRARDYLIDELRRLRAKNIVISTNLNLRNDGLPRANQRKPEDRGVAVYFTLKENQKCFPCDKWDRVEDNIYAIAKTIEALREIERWGSQSMVDATFNGFKALPDPNEIISWCEILGVFGPANDPITKKNVISRYRELAKIHHPDRGGSAEEFNIIQRAYDQACRDFERFKNE